MAARPRGAAALVAALLILPLAGAATLAWHAADAADRRAAALRDAGRVWAAWVAALHRGVQGGRAAWADDLGDAPATLSPADVAALAPVPPGLPRALRAGTLAFGVLDDDGVPSAPAPDTAMAWGVLELASEGDATLAAAGASPLAALAVRAGGVLRGDPAIAAHVPRIEAALGRALADNALVATADRAIPWRPSVMYRRAQPGRPWASRMEAALTVAAADVVSARRLEGRRAAVSGAAAALGAVPDPANPPPPPSVSADLVIGTAADRGVLTARAGLSADRVETACLDAAGAPVAPPADCVAVGGAVAAGAATLSGDLDAASVSADNRVEAARATVARTAAAGWAVAAESATARASAEARALLRAARIEAREMTAGAAATDDLRAPSLAAGRALRSPVSGVPVSALSATVRRVLSVRVSCDGCAP